MIARKSERLFLIEGPVPDLSVSPCKRIARGCISHERSREVWLVREDQKYGLAVLDESADIDACESQPIPQETFEALWQSTHPHHVQLMRHQLMVGTLPVEIDLFDSPHSPLATARVRFATAAEARRFKKPAFFGREFPRLGTLREIALYGTPHPHEIDLQAGAVPFLFKKGILHIVLITSSSGARWLIPKGHLEPGMTPGEVALMEAAEEAGAIGTIERGCRIECPTEDGRTLQLFPLRVATLLPHWPERFARRRVVLPVYRALLRISDPALAKALRELTRSLKP